MIGQSWVRKIQSVMEVAPRYVLFTFFNCLHCLHHSHCFASGNLTDLFCGASDALNGDDQRSFHKHMLRDDSDMTEK